MQGFWLILVVLYEQMEKELRGNFAKTLNKSTNNLSNAIHT